MDANDLVVFVWGWSSVFGPLGRVGREGGREKCLGKEGKSNGREGGRKACAFFCFSCVSRGEDNGQGG